MREKILCDSCCDFTATEKLSSGFDKVPATVSVSGNRLVDDKQFRQAALLAALEVRSLELGVCFPDEQAYLCAFDCGAQEIYVVTASTALGDHYATASRAKRAFLLTHPDVLIHVFNTRTVSAGELLAARKIGHMLRSGCTFRQIVSSVERYILEISTCLLTETAQSLREQGLLGPQRPFQPERLLLQLDFGGQVKPLGGALTENALTRKLLVHLLKQANTAGKTCLIAHSGCPDKAGRIAQQLRNADLFSEFLFLETGAVNTLLLGRGGLALAY